MKLCPGKNTNNTIFNLGNNICMKFIVKDINKVIDLIDNKNWFKVSNIVFLA